MEFKFMNGISGINNQKNVSFGTRIKVLPMDYYNFGSNNFFRSIYNQEIKPLSGIAYQNDIFLNTIIGVRSPKKSELGTFMEYEDDDMEYFFGNTKKMITDACASLKQGAAKLTGFVIGADSSSSGLDSVEIAKKHINVLKEQSVKPTIFVGQPARGTRIKYSHPDDTLCIYPDMEVKDVEGLREAYKYIRVADGDELIIMDKQVDPKDIPDTARALLID